MKPLDVKETDSFEDKLSYSNIADILYCLERRRDDILNKVQFYHETIKDCNSRRVNLLNDCLMTLRSELNSIENTIFIVKKMI